MSFSEDVLLAKFSTLNETQESIISISQWVMFHRRYASQSAEIWSKYTKKIPANKRLSLIYLANEVVQQSRAKKRDEFVRSFAKYVPDVIGFTYRQASADIKPKIKRVVDVWRQRNIFSPDVQTATEEALNEPSNPRKGGLFGNSKLGGSSPELPPFLSKLSTLYKTLTTSISASDISTKTATTEYEALIDSDTPPVPAEYAKRLAILEPKIASAHLNLSNSVNARRDLIAQLESLASSSRELLKEDEKKLKDIEEKRSKVQELRSELDFMLVNSNGAASDGINKEESTTPPGSPPSSSNAAPQASFLYEEDADEEANQISTPPAPPSNDATFGGLSFEPEESDIGENLEEYKPQAPQITKPVNDSVPTYVESSSDEDEDDDSKKENGPAVKRAKIEQPATSINPQIAQFLSSLAKSGSILDQKEQQQ